VLVLVAADGRVARETLYLPAKDERYELWNGPRMAPGEAAAAASGIADTRPLEALDADLVGLVGLARGSGSVLASGDRARDVLERAGADVRRPSRTLRAVQVVKDAGEIAATRAAIDITQEALTDALRVAVPGAWEFTAEAQLSGGFRTRGAEALAFPSICGSGPNSCHLHYRSNERRLADGDLLVLDVGAKYRHYCADVTRTIPVNGRFSARQREIYTLVWEASRRAAAALRPGATLGEAHEVARQVFLQRFDADQVKKYFPHSVGHGLGLRVHDAPSARQKLEPGMVVTIEPGLYLAEEELGVRIEDDYLITADGAELLSDDVPSHPDELEAFLAEIRAR
jgi:Xaa-Pro aminopeptidase